MIKSPEILEEFEKNIALDPRLKMNYKEALKIFEALWHEAVVLERIPHKNKLEDIEKDIELASNLKRLGEKQFLKN